jgi:hypothetical protein
MLSNYNRRTRVKDMSRRIFSGAIFIIICFAGHAWSMSVASNDQTRTSNQVSRANSDFIAAARKNKESVQGLIPHYEAVLKTATVEVEKRKELQAKGLVSKSELASGDQAVKDAQAQLDNARRQLVESDHLIAEASAPPAKPGSSGSSGTGRYTTSAAVMRYSGAGRWALTQASQVKDFFTAKFGRQLPISALGQSQTHNRLRFDHSNSVDVALHPDSAEGKALIEYLRSNGIPYLAFRSAIRGVATGAHIHIGRPSHRL